MKRYDSTAKRCTFDILSDDTAKKMSYKAKWDGFRKKNLKLWSLFQECAELFRLRDISFISDEQDAFSIFQSLKHKLIKEINMNTIQLYLDFIKEVIAANDIHIYEYILNWISFIIQHPGVKSTADIIIRGVQETGKNTFTDVICDVMADAHRRNFEHFDKIQQTINQADFYANLYTFFMKRDISQANLQVIPITEAKKDIKQVNKSPVDNFVVKYLKQLKQRMECNFAEDCKPKELTEFQFKA
ncbi:MAG: hypothetical protein EZS28_001659 [Streblomastix strix]|uniref:Uncharacterized protein n=1 Tax=Streblomastix strix TaxID=222440 RepID=A0A5J4X8G8_9EUKA|nr:MAG: hypothetical protein EZS28_001659 [Streblomastix strix]